MSVALHANISHHSPITPIEQWLCNVRHNLEDKVHFPVQCNMFTDELTACLHQIWNKYSQFIAFDNTKKLIVVLQNEDTRIIT